MAVGKTPWKLHASRARELTQPMQVQQHHISCAGSKFWAQELEGILEDSLWEERNLQHLLPKFQCHDQALTWHIDLLDKIIEHRAQSLVSMHETPPLCYAHVLSVDQQDVIRACNQACKDWETLLEAEAAAREGAKTDPLQHMHYRHNPVTRVVYLAFEQDRQNGQEGIQGRSEAHHLLSVLTRHPGDSRLIEVAHQQAKDVLRSSKQNTFANTAIMSQVLSSKILEGRKMDVLKATPADKAHAPVQRGKC